MLCHRSWFQSSHHSIPESNVFLPLVTVIPSVSSLRWCKLILSRIVSISSSPQGATIYHDILFTVLTGVARKFVWKVTFPSGEENLVKLWSTMRSSCRSSLVSFSAHYVASRKSSPYVCRMGILGRVSNLTSS
ncbi:hypothetical protein MPTK1_3g18200 [Marchantia polymorpha subsp. ruderalis]|uniref:Uncharacterized protein n=2 Tax=Marchantia polymorpha TaxID=3197 RepID=A0AAF6B246_MARPO|nr:hypothetical protein MARPO_0140s0021 [Marchantia polymorpha]PTQ29487.1 hypothetical protein MARPO_0140s0021 [Marchantia polymorpha]BBN06080.1 hypothetical protein Mp_3g18200 [Marchantia polymorpha subsp. ruderalis]BBN06081.1 hypothetical protein Mp_3g18200 [Marchantia polymorpha subsp. ruderalis]|eukprot:PTQ29486.1 hypothetical protein MARPO_0140s0021 [Marchantia polymorpha]